MLCPFGTLTLASLLASWLVVASGQGQPIPVTGMTTGMGERAAQPPLRMNINMLDKSKDPAWDLYILAIAALMNRTQSDEESYFSIAVVAIKRWGKAEVFQRKHNSSHGTARTFCSMRSANPLTLLFTLMRYGPEPDAEQQILGQEVQRIAAQYTGTENSSYQKSAQSFRLPFWDWANDPTLPPSATLPQITVQGPQGPTTIDNPLYNYKWQTYPLDQNLFPGSGDWAPYTTRDGDNNFDPDKVNANLLSNSDQIKDTDARRPMNEISKLKNFQYRTFSSATSFDEMSSMGGGPNSFEFPHNLIHNAIGGGYANLYMSSFDPLFTLQHANIDRLVSIWTALNPDKTYQNSTYSSGGLYATAAGEAITKDSPLKPFYQAGGQSFHTGVSVQALTDFGYTYPELEGVGTDVSQNRRLIISHINKLYGRRFVAAEGRRARTSGRKDGAAAPRIHTEWFVEVQVDKADVSLPCGIDFYLGDSPAGKMALLDMPRAGLVYSEIPLSRAIDDAGMSGSDWNSTEDRLGRELRFEIRKSDGAIVDPGAIPSLRLIASSEDVTPPASDTELPKYSNKRTSAVIFARYHGTS
ncbi:Di-copper centre-containing protein [Xylariomycetidae sp. FL2044]|nr:Di-copper centre-containing protein [Xylariomycetidae sp. FL2044]